MNFNAVLLLKLPQNLQGIFRLAACAYTGQSPITKLSTTKLVRKKSPCLVQQKQFLVLPRQSVTVLESAGDKKSRQEKFWAQKRRHQKVDDPHYEIRSPHNKENIIQKKLFWRQ